MCTITTIYDECIGNLETKHNLIEKLWNDNRNFTFQETLLAVNCKNVPSMEDLSQEKY